MSDRSRRRNAELAVIDAAEDLLRKGATASYASFGSFARATDIDITRVTVDAAGWGNLRLACSALRHLGLAAPTGTPVNVPSTPTAADAAASMRKIVGKVVGDVFLEILAAHYTYGVTGLTADAIQVRLKGTHQGISPRITELRDKGWIMDSGLRRPTRSGRQAIVWKATQLGLDGSRLVKEWSW